MEIDSLVVNHCDCLQLLAYQFRLHFADCLLVMVVGKYDLVRPFVGGVGYNYIVLIRHAYTGDLEDGCVLFICHTVKLVGGSVVRNPRSTLVAALIARNDASYTVQIVGGGQFGVLHIRYGVIRPAVATCCAGRFE